MGETKAVFIGQTRSGGSQFSAGDWTPPESEIEPLDEYQNEAEFTLSYTASDSVSEVDKVLLFYRYQGGDWIQTATDEDVTGFFDFIASDGDGEYEFFSIAVDIYGNIEDDIDEDGVLEDDELPFFGDTSTIVDTSSPVTMLSVEPYMAIANELLYNGGFESGNLDGWTVDSVGSDHQITTDDQKTGAYSALIGFRDAFPSAEPAYDSVKQTVSLPSVITSTLSFWYRLITDDLVSGGFFDAFVTPTGSDPITVAHDGWDDPLVLVEDLGWKNVTYQLTGLEGKEIEIQFKVSQPYENYRTWSYLDDVKVCAATNSATTATDFSFSSHDGSGSNNSTITYSVDGEAPETYTDPINLTEGKHSITYSSEDEAGNVETEKRIDITVQADPVEFGVVLNEFLPDPGGDDFAAAPNGEWVELYNNSSAPIDVNGWKLEDADGNQMTISAIKTEGAGTIISPGGVLKVYRRGSAEGTGPTFIMNNDGDTVKLLKPDDTQVDSYSYTFTIEDKSFTRDPDGTGGWKDPWVVEPIVDFYLQPNKAAVGFKVSGISASQKVDYQISYDSANGRQGIMGTIELSGENEIIRENFTLGTCSTGGTCVYHQEIKEIKLELKLIDNEDKEMIIEKKINL